MTAPTESVQPLPETAVRQHFLSEEMFPERGLKVYRIEDAQSGQLPHSHDYMQVWYIARGECHHWVEGIEHRMVAGEAFVIPPDVPHQTNIQPKSEIIGCEFSLSAIFKDKDEGLFKGISDSIIDLSFMMLFNPAQTIRPKYAFSPRSQLQVERVIYNILDEYEKDGEYSQDILQLEILHLLLLFAREYKEEHGRQETRDYLEQHKEAVKKTLEYINAQYMNKLSLEDVYRRAHLSKTYYCYLFKLLTGQTFVEYLTQVRISHAKLLLADAARSITEIAQEVGFNEASHFSRTFRKLTGLSPSDYRQHYLNRSK